MTTPLQQAAKAMIDRWESPDWKDTPHTAHYIAELRKALDAEITQSAEPYAVFQGLVDSGEHGAFNLDLLKMIPRGAYLYLHSPQPQATTPAVPELLEELENCRDLLKIAFPDAPVDSCIGVGIIKASAAIAAAQGEKP